MFPHGKQLFIPGALFASVLVNLVVLRSPLQGSPALSDDSSERFPLCIKDWDYFEPRLHQREWCNGPLNSPCYDLIGNTLTFGVIAVSDPSVTTSSDSTQTHWRDLIEHVNTVFKSHANDIPLVQFRLDGLARAEGIPAGPILNGDSMLVLMANMVDSIEIEISRRFDLPQHSFRNHLLVFFTNRSIAFHCPNDSLTYFLKRGKNLCDGMAYLDRHVAIISDPMASPSIHSKVFSSTARILVHEILHTFGVQHTNSNESVMDTLGTGSERILDESKKALQETITRTYGLSFFPRLPLNLGGE